MAETESPEAGLPTKVCLHCSEQSQTAAEACPACGKSFRRRGITTGRATLIMVPVALLLAAGAFKLIGSAPGDSGDKAKTPEAPPRTAAEKNAITLQEARGIPLGSTADQVLSRLGPPKENAGADEPLAAVKAHRCVYYNFAGTPEGDFRLCYKDGRLGTVTAVYPRSQAPKPEQ